MPLGKTGKKYTKLPKGELMSYQEFCALYSAEIYLEFQEEDVYASLGYTFDQYMMLKYENFIEDNK
ncbi:hypothetical protein THIOSC13_1200005 [uncultured Thiomicrorhabdus sp.]